MNKVVLVVAAHSDDEALGCSGTMAKHIGAGDKVHVLFMTNGVDARGEGEETNNERENSALEAMNILRVTSMQNLDFPDNRMDTVALLDVTKAIEEKIAELHPEIVYTHHLGDLNIDHQITHKAVMTACRPTPNFCVKEIYAFEVLSSTEWQTPNNMPFIPNMFVDISPYINLKKSVLEAYGQEMREQPHSRSIANVLRKSAVNGNLIGCAYAEAFSALRVIR